MSGAWPPDSAGRDTGWSADSQEGGLGVSRLSLSIASILFFNPASPLLFARVPKCIWNEA